MKKATLKVLADSDLERIHQATLRILWKVGVVIKDSEARSILKREGAKVDEENMRVFIPPYIVEEAIRRAPKTFVLWSRDFKTKYIVDEENLFYEPMIGRLFIHDFETNSLRRTSLKDVENLVKIADALPNYHLLHSGAIMPEIQGVQIGTSHAHGYLASLRNSTKVIKTSSREKSVAEDMVRMVSVVAGGLDKLKEKPITFTTCNPVAPLQHDREQTEGMRIFIKHGIPVDITSEPQAGATAPVTLAGLLTQQNADILSGIVIAEMDTPGAPVWYGTCGAIMDMKVGRIALGSIEAGLINVASAQMAKFYGLPCRGTGAVTESKLLDFQAGVEVTQTLYFCALGGINLMFYPGCTEGGLAVSLERLVLDNEIAGMAYRALSGVEVDEETIAEEVIQTVGPSGHYLSQPHTMKYLRKEQYLPKLVSREIRAKFEEAGSKSMVERAHEEVERILSEHKVPPLDPKVESELLNIIQEVERRTKQNG
ncbi:MAG: trimethylamine methyltransferase family protein [Caldiserica bacterium]|jgi:trimethylamine--corrinoid protein Co-methyltransferase|nr:trimethylamine methyltransferase family protein [Caldisericota bacterium]